jgi:N-acetylglucosamine-6-sulfatase
MHRPRWAALLVVVNVLATGCTHTKPSPSPPGSTPPSVTTTGPHTAVEGQGRRPNVLVLLSDDQAFRLFERKLMPRTFSKLVDQGAWFTRNYVNDSECCPSRASILTGLYAHDTGVDSNFRPLDGTAPVRPTFVEALHQAGYRTMLDGKYLNSESCDRRPGWDEWVCGRDMSMSEVDPVLTVDGTTSTVHGFTADILADHAVDFIRHTDRRRPFFVYYSPRDPHLPANDPRGGGVPIARYRPPSFNAQPDPSTKPRWARLPALGPPGVRHIDEIRTRMAQQLPPLDAAMGRILDALGDRAADTLVIYMSDNGFLYGEHRMTDKTQPYEESVRVPLAIRWPRVLPPSEHFVSSALTENVDLAPTIMDAAGIPWAADGTSLLTLLSRRAMLVHHGVLTEWCQAGLGPCPQFSTGKAPPYWGLETERYAYIEYETGERELYDLNADPFQLMNLAVQASRRTLVSELAAQLRALRTSRSPPDTTIAIGPPGPQSSGPVSFEFFSQSRTTGFDCRLFGPGQGGWHPCPTGSETFPSLQAGHFTFEVRAKAADGTLDPTPARREFTIGD